MPEKEEGQKTKTGFSCAEGKGHLLPWRLKYLFSVPEALGHKRIVCHPKPQEVVLCFTPHFPVPRNGRVIGRSCLSYAIFQKRSEFFFPD